MREPGVTARSPGAQHRGPGGCLHGSRQSPRPCNGPHPARQAGLRRRRIRQPAARRPATRSTGGPRALAASPDRADLARADLATRCAVAAAPVGGRCDIGARPAAGRLEGLPGRHLRLHAFSALRHRHGATEAPFGEATPGHRGGCAGRPGLCRRCRGLRPHRGSAVGLADALPALASRRAFCAQRLDRKAGDRWASCPASGSMPSVSSECHPNNETATCGRPATTPSM